MKRITAPIILVLSLILFTSCFDIMEEVNFNKNNSGTFKFYFQFKNASILQQKANNEMANTINEIRNVNNIYGIRNFEYIVNNEQYQFGLQFNFDNINVLNQALQIIFKTDSTTYFAEQDGQIIRYEHNNIMQNIDENLGESKAYLDINQLFNDATYTTKYTFESKIDSTKNKNTNIDANTASNTLYLINKEKNIKSKTLADTIYISK